MTRNGNETDHLLHNKNVLVTHDNGVPDTS